MRTSRISKGGAVVNYLSGLFLFTLVLSAFLYFPVMLDQMNLEALMGEVTLKKGVPDTQELIDAFIQEAERQYDIILFEEDVEIIRTGKVITLYVIWRPIIEIPIIHYEFELEKDLVNERVVL